MSLTRLLRCRVGCEKCSQSSPPEFQIKQETFPVRCSAYTAKSKRKLRQKAAHAAVCTAVGGDGIDHAQDFGVTVSTLPLIALGRPISPKKAVKTGQMVNSTALEWIASTVANLRPSLLDTAAAVAVTSPPLPPPAAPHTAAPSSPRR
eukprot:5591703-Pleurochrysis_carterae.AAC.1